MNPKADVLIQEANRAFGSGERRTGIKLIHRVLKMAPAHDVAWRLLHQHIGGAMPFDLFQRNWSQKYLTQQADAPAEHLPFAELIPQHAESKQLLYCIHCGAFRFPMASFCVQCGKPFPDGPGERLPIPAEFNPDPSSRSAEESSVSLPTITSPGRSAPVSVNPPASDEPAHITVWLWAKILLMITGSLIIVLAGFLPWAYAEDLFNRLEFFGFENRLGQTAMALGTTSLFLLLTVNKKPLALVVAWLFAGFAGLLAYMNLDTGGRFIVPGGLRFGAYYDVMMLVIWGATMVSIGFLIPAWRRIREPSNMPFPLALLITGIVLAAGYWWGIESLGINVLGVLGLLF